MNKILLGITLLMAGQVIANENAMARKVGFGHYAAWKPDSTLHYLVPLYKANPGDDSLGLAVAEASLWKKDYKTATNVLSALRNPNAPHANRVKGLLYEQVGRFDEALQAYDLALPGLAQPWGTLERKAQVLAWTKQTDKAIVVAQQVISSEQASEGLRQRCALHVALWSAWKNDLKGALAITEKVLSKDPKHVDALLLLGQLQEWNGNFAKAKKAYGDVLASQPNHADARLRLGKLQWVK